MTAQQIPTEDRLLKIKDVINYVNFSKAKIYVLLKQQAFPTPIKIGGSVLWSFIELQEYMNAAKQNNRVTY